MESRTNIICADNRAGLCKSDVIENRRKIFQDQDLDLDNHSSLCKNGLKLFRVGQKKLTQ